MINNQDNKEQIKFVLFVKAFVKSVIIVGLIVVVIIVGYNLTKVEKKVVGAPQNGKDSIKINGVDISVPSMDDFKDFSDNANNMTDKIKSLTDKFIGGNKNEVKNK